MPVSAIFMLFFKLGCTAFGGPIAHLGYFQRTFVEEKQWLSAQEYSELIALCNFLPGPASSQVSMALGYRKGGILGSIAAFAGFTLPSMLIMIALAWCLLNEPPPWVQGILHGLKLLAVVVVADAVLKMATKIATEKAHKALLLGSTFMMLLIHNGTAQLGGLLVCGVIAWLFLPAQAASCTGRPRVHPLLRTLVLLAGGWLLLQWLPASYQWLSSFYQVGATVMGGGHVVLPMLSAESAIVQPLTQTQFLAGYGFAQAVPGPMFTFASYLGTLLSGNVLGGVLATLLIFLPGWLLVIGLLPIWQQLRSIGWLAAFIGGIHIGVVGLLAATLYRYVFTGTVTTPADAAWVVLLWGVLTLLRAPIWLLIMLAALGGAGIEWLQ